VKPKKVDMESGTSRIWNGDCFHGTTACYAATPDDHTAFQCDCEFETLFESKPREVRAFREERRRNGKSIRKLGASSLRSEHIVAFGPEMSALDAVNALRRLAKIIGKNGLLIGKRKDDEYVTETAEENKVEGLIARRSGKFTGNLVNYSVAIKRRIAVNSAVLGSRR
jgi:hypothetical protein